MNRVGHAFFKVRMRDEGGAFGGEVSGHYYFADFYNADRHGPGAADPRCSPRRAPSSPSWSSSSAPSTSSRARSTRGRGRGQEDDRDRGALLRREVSKLDGISVDYDDWHFNVRASNTEPLLRLNLESLVSKEDMEQRRDEVLQLIRS